MYVCDCVCASEGVLCCISDGHRLYGWACGSVCKILLKCVCLHVCKHTRQQLREALCGHCGAILPLQSVLALVNPGCPAVIWGLGEGRGLALRRALGSGFLDLDSGSLILRTGFRFLDSGFWVLGPGFLDSGYPVLGFRVWIIVPGNLDSDSGF